MAKKRLVLVLLAVFVCVEVAYNSDSCKNFLTNHLATFLSHSHDHNSLLDTSYGLSSPEAYIAHAGGRIGEHQYTNSREALEDSVRRGYKYVELDLLVTRDGHIVAAHDWKTLAGMTGRRSAEVPLSLKEAVGGLLYGKYHVLSGEDIAGIMRENPHLVLVTDKIEDYAALARELPFRDRMIVEVFRRWDYLKCLWYGFTPAFSLPWKLEDLEKVKGLDVLCYTTPGIAWREGYDGLLVHLEKLRSAGKSVLLFTAGTPEALDMEGDAFLEKNFRKYFSKIYTDAERRFTP